MALTRRVIGAVSRRTERPELLAAVYPQARQVLREELAINALLASTLSSDSTYVDVGTNRGQILREAVRVAPLGRHLAFEPIPELASDLARSFPMVDGRQVALGARAQTASFCYFRSLDGWSGLHRNPSISDQRGDPEYITVQVSTLDAEIEELVPRLVKIDVEGHEMGVLEGARATLAQSRPFVIFEHAPAVGSLAPTSSHAIWDLLTELRYRIFSVTGEGPFTNAEFAQSTNVLNWLASPDVSSLSS
jgi:FkbM family methyltransferase